MIAPIVIFAFNRPKALLRLKESLEKNNLFATSEKIVFIDGYRNEKEKEKVDEVIRIARTITENVQISQVNKGLGTSIIEGISSVIRQYGKAIVLEDDLICSSNFLSFMNQALDFYQDDPRIFSVCGYGLKIDKPKNYMGDIYLSGRSSSWGWGTWKDRWEQVDWEVKDWESLSNDKKKQKAFNRNGSDMYDMLKDYMHGRNRSWAIRFCYSQFKLEKYSVCPFISKIENDGFGEDATNCKQHYSRFKADFDNTTNQTFLFPHSPEPDKKIMAACYKYHSLPIRIYSKLRNLI